MELTIKWNPVEVRKMEYDFFKKLCKGQYKSHYKNKKNEDIQKEYEFITGTKLKKE